MRRALWVGPAAALAVAAAMALAAGGPAGGSQDGLRIGAQPGLVPAFDTGVSDYVSRCGRSRPLTLSVHAPSGQTVSVDGGSARSGDFNAKVALTAGQAGMLSFLVTEVAFFGTLGSSAAAVYGDMRLIDEHGHDIGSWFAPMYARPEGDVFAQLIAGNFVPAPTVMTRRSALDQAGQFALQVAPALFERRPDAASAPVDHDVERGRGSRG